MTGWCLILETVIINNRKSFLWPTWMLLKNIFAKNHDQNLQTTFSFIQFSFSFITHMCRRPLPTGKKRCYLDRWHVDELSSLEFAAFAFILESLNYLLLDHFEFNFNALYIAVQETNYMNPSSTVHCYQRLR